MSQTFKLQPKHRIGLACSKESSRYAIEQVKAENLGNGQARLTATDGRMLVECIAAASGEWESTNIDRNSMKPAGIVKAETEFRDNGYGLAYSIKAKEPQAGESSTNFPPTKDVLIPRSPGTESMVFSVQIGLLRTIIDAMEDQTLSPSDRKSQVISIQISRSSSSSDARSADKPIRFLAGTESGSQVLGMLMPVNNDIGNDAFDDRYGRGALA